MQRQILVSSHLELFLAVCAAAHDVEPPVAASAYWSRLIRRGDRTLLSRLRNIGGEDFWMDLAIQTSWPASSTDEDPVDLLGSAPLKTWGDRGGQDAEELRFTVIDGLRRFQRQVFVPFWRQVSEELEAAVERLRPGLTALPPSQIPEYLGLPAMPAAASEHVVLAPTVFPAQARRYRARLDPGSTALLLPFDLLGARREMQPPNEISASTVASARPVEPGIALVFRALGDTTRYAVATLLAREPLTGAELARRLSVTKPTMTHHLQQLRQAGLLKEERRGNSVVSRLDRDAVATISEAAIRQLYDGAVFEDSARAPLLRSRRASTS
jgi:DNA-binding transcriptional ArsR family regulator